VGVLVSLALLEGALRPDLSARFLWVPLVVALLPTLLWRRTRPLLMVAIALGTASLTSLLAGEQPELYTAAAFVILPYALFRWGSGREVVIGSAILLVNSGVAMVVDGSSLADAIGGLAVLSATAALGVAFRFRAKVRIRELDQVKLVERERLARDLHDTVAHHVSAMAIRAQAGLATSASRPDAAADALRVIEAEASRTLAEMRAMVRVLRRSEPADMAPTPGVSNLQHLASPGRAGPATDVQVSGDVDDLPPAVGTALYRLAQESVTNALRHPRHATRIEVRVAADDTTVRLRVTDDGDAGPARLTPPMGYGLLGMVERAELLGGTCQAGPNPGRGWTVTAVLPRSGFAP
jgi:signal transduction histidine kinase